MVNLRQAESGNLFALSEELLNPSASKPAGSVELLMTPKEVERKLNSIEDKLVVEDATNITKDGYYFDLKHLINCFDELNGTCKLKLIGLVQSAFSKHNNLLKNALFNSRGGFEGCEWRQSCEMYSVTVLNVFGVAERSSQDKSSNKTTSAKSKKDSNLFEWNHLRIALLENAKTFVSLPLGRVFDSATEKETLISCIVKAAHASLESVENVKSVNCKKAALDVLCYCACKQGYSFGLKTIILQDLTFFEHLAEPMAELVSYFTKEETSCPDIVEDIFKSLGSYRFSPQESTTSTKIASIFFAKFASISPKEALKNLSLYIEQIDSEAYVLRMAMIEVVGLLILHLTMQEERSESQRAQTKSLYVALEERFRDVNSFVRAKVLNVCCDLARTSAIPVFKRPRLLQLAADRIMDKSSNVRRKAIQLLGEFLRTHPFCVDGGELKLAYFQNRLAEIDRALDEAAPAAIQELPKKDANDMELEDEEEKEELNQEQQQDDASSAAGNQIGALIAQKQYYSDAIKFVTLINSVIPKICLLLSSTTKSEVFEVMEFLVEANIYKLESANEGIRKMLHLVWEQELSSEDGTKTSVREHLIENYRKIYLDVDERLSSRERAHQVALNLISLMEGITVAEMASLKELLGFFMKKNLISESVINQLFLIFAAGEQQQFSKTIRRSALILVSMLSQNKRDIIEKRLDAFVKIGLGAFGQADPLVAQYSLVAIQNLVGSPEESIKLRLPHDNILFVKIVNFVQNCCNSSKWYPVINEAVNALFLLSDKPSVLISSLLTELSREMFYRSDREMTDVSQPTLKCNRNQLCKFLLILGQVALCHNGHLDLIERHGKDVAQKQESKEKRSAQDDLNKVTGTAEDDFAEVVKGVREQEILYSTLSLLAVFAPIVSFICSNNTVFADLKVQRVATLTLAKLMTTSPVFCEQNLQLFLTIMEYSNDPVIRSNMVIGFGDLAQNFNRLIDQNIEYLFNRLSDVDLTVRRNTLLVLTHLSLTGMIKIKGQIGEIAKCLIDQDERICNLAKLFFSEMAARDSGTTVQSNGIYNHIPDILSHLSATDSMVCEDDFRTIMRFIFDFIKKEKQMENLIEKLCVRFRQSDSIRHSRDLAFCLSLVSFAGDRALKKLIEAFPLYQDKLVDDAVLTSFVEIVNRSKKFCKAELKALLDEFEQRIVQAANGNMISAGAVGVNNFAALSQSISKKKKATTTGKTATTRKPAAGKKNNKMVDSDDDEEEDYDMIDDSENNTAPNTTKVQSRTSGRRAAAAVKFVEEAVEESYVQVPRAGSSRRSQMLSTANRAIVDDDDDDIF